MTGFVQRHIYSKIESGGGGIGRGVNCRPTTLTEITHDVESVVWSMSSLWWGGQKCGGPGGGGRGVLGHRLQ